MNRFGRLVLRERNAEFDMLLKSQKLKSSVDKAVEAIFERVWDSEMKELKNTVNNNESKVADIQNKIKLLTDLAIKAKSDVIRGAYEKEIEDNAELIAVIEQNEPFFEDTDIPYQTALKKAKGLLESPYKIWVSLDIEERQKLFFFIFDEKLPYSKKQVIEPINCHVL